MYFIREHPSQIKELKHSNCEEHSDQAKSLHFNWPKVLNAEEIYTLLLKYQYVGIKYKLFKMFQKESFYQETSMYFFSEWNFIVLAVNLCFHYRYRN